MAKESRFTRLLCGQIHFRPAGAGDDEAAGRLAAIQEGVAARWQLLDLGVSDDAICYRIRAGRFHRFFPGVYAVGHAAVSPVGRALAAVLSCWPNAAASHETALFLAGVIQPPSGLPHVTATEPRKDRSGLVVHRSALPTEDLTWFHGVPTTALPRTFLDLAADRDPAWLRRRIKDAEFMRKLTVLELVAVLDRHPRRRGRRALAEITRPLLSEDGRRTRSSLEDHFLDFCRRRRLPIPETNVRLRINGRTYEPDCVWRQAGVVVELDGRDAHARELAFSDDRARDRALIAAGWIPIRVPAEHLAHTPAALERDLRAALANGSGSTRTGAG